MVETPDEGAPIAAEPMPRHGEPFAGPLVPEQILVLTYNVKAARELGERLDRVVGPAVRARMTERRMARCPSAHATAQAMNTRTTERIRKSRG